MALSELPQEASAMYVSGFLLQLELLDALSGE
jgi:hypothetical protein